MDKSVIGVGGRLGPYEIASALGAGGMGEVYRARDTRLDRDVAIKVLPESFALDADRVARFTREAKTLAALNHPNIAAIYGIEEQGAVRALVIELVDGEDLAQVIARGPVPLDEALPIARQIADALEAAHEQGIVHRDLKPANVRVRPDGTVKVLDFGLAKGGDAARASGVDPMNSPTLTARGTQMGMIIGTAAYMSPEQAKGRAVDKRADIWAFGAVFYEMLTGRRAFKGDDAGDTLASVLKETPDLDALPASVPPRLRGLVRDCLVRDPKHRLRDIGEARILLERLASVPDAAAAKGAAVTAASTASSRVLPWTVAGLVAVAASALAVPAVRHLREAPSAPVRVASLTMGVAPAERLGPTAVYERPSRTAFAISPDGATIVFAGETTPPGGTATTMLYRRLLADAKPVAIPGTERAEYPFFSPDGQWIGFAAGSQLKKVAVSGGLPIDLCEIRGPSGFGGGNWGGTGLIVFSASGLWTVPDAGGRPEQLLAGAGALTPAILPDGQTVVFTEAPPSRLRWANAHVDAVNIKTRQRRTLLNDAADARYSPTGHLVFVRNATLLAVPFDVTRVEVTGAAVPLVGGVMQSTNAAFGIAETGMGQFALSASGTLVYAAGGINPIVHSALVRVDRKGIETPLAETVGRPVGLRISADGRRLVTARTGDGSRETDLWLYDLPSGAPTRLTATGESNWPLFSPASRTLTFTRGGEKPGIYALSFDSNEPPRVLAAGPGEGPTATSWSPDGKWLAYIERVNGVRQIFVRAAHDGVPDGEPRRLVPSTFDQTHAEFSPDGRWLAYASNESGTDEVYVVPFPAPGQRRRVSVNGGTSPAWSRDGRELFFGKNVTVNIRTVALYAVEVAQGGSFEASAPRKLFEGPYPFTTPSRTYDVTSDGQFIMSRVDEVAPEPVTVLNVVLGWAETLKGLVPATR